MSEWVTAISSVGFPIAACVGLGWFVSRVISGMQEASARREDDLMRIITAQGESLKQIAFVLESVSERLEDVEVSLERLKLH